MNLSGLSSMNWTGSRLNSPRTWWSPVFVAEQWCGAPWIRRKAMPKKKAVPSLPPVIAGCFLQTVNLLCFGYQRFGALLKWCPLWFYMLVFFEANLEVNPSRNCCKASRNCWWFRSSNYFRSLGHSGSFPRKISDESGWLRCWTWVISCCHATWSGVSSVP